MEEAWERLGSRLDRRPVARGSMSHRLCRRSLRSSRASRHRGSRSLPGCRRRTPSSQRWDGLSTLTTKLQALTDFDGVLAEKEGSSSNTDVLALSSATALRERGQPRHHRSTVARADILVVYSGAIAAADTLSGSIRHPGGLGHGADNHGWLRRQQHVVQAGRRHQRCGAAVKASVSRTRQDRRLSIVSSTSGSAGQLTVTNNLE